MHQTYLELLDDDDDDDDELLDELLDDEDELLDDHELEEELLDELEELWAQEWLGCARSMGQYLSTTVIGNRAHETLASENAARTAHTSVPHGIPGAAR